MVRVLRYIEQGWPVERTIQSIVNMVAFAVWRETSLDALIRY